MTHAALAQALAEDIVRVASDVRVEAVRVDADRVCSGRNVDLVAEVSGADGTAVYRWVRLAGEGAEIVAGRFARWTAPDEPGQYHLLFQVCAPGEGRSVGVLAERALQVDVVDCTGGGDAEPLRIEARDRAAGQYVFHAVHAAGETAASYRWDFGDGVIETTTEPRAAHFYPLAELVEDEVRGYRVRLQTAGAGPARSAAVTVYLRGQARPPAPPEVLVELEDPRYDDGRERWEVRLRVSNRTRPPITWRFIERTTIDDDRRSARRSEPWRTLVVDARKQPDGSFVGWVVVDAADAPPAVVRVVDRLVGRDADGQEVAVTYSPYKRRDVDAEPGPPPDKTP